MTWLQWCQAQHQRISDSGEIQVFEKWTLHHEYHRSVGLHAFNAFIDPLNPRPKADGQWDRMKPGEKWKAMG